MPGITNTQGLIYQTGSDRPCDSWEFWSNLADAVESKMLVYNDVLNRTNRAVPMVKVAANIAQTIPIGSTFFFNQILVDTDNMANFDQSASAVTIRRTGLFEHAGRVQLTDGVSGQFHSAFEQTGFVGTVGGEERSGLGGSNQMYLTTRHQSREVDVNPDDTYSLDADTSGVSSPVPIYGYAELFLIWHADL